MAKRKKIKKAGFICLVLFAVMCVMPVLNFVLPQFSVTFSLDTLVGGGTTDATQFGMLDLLDGMSDKSASDRTDGGNKAYAAFFADGDKTQAAWFTVFALVTTIVACIGIVLAVVSIIMPKLGGYIKYVGFVLALLAIVTFILGIVVTQTFSSSSNIGGLASGSYTVKLAVGAILSLVGGILSAAVPVVLKK